MSHSDWVLATDRGGHLQNAQALIKQIGIAPTAIVTTYGPDVDTLKQNGTEVHWVPYLFTWLGKTRLWNPLSAMIHIIVAWRLAWRLRPKVVVSLGASNVVVFCYFARALGSKVIHVECMNQVHTPSVTGKLLYPICETLFVQWQELLKQYGQKAKYAGWVL